MSAERGQPLQSWEIIAYVVIVGGIALRLMNLRNAELWADEIFSVTLAESPFLDLVLTALRFDVHPPLYYVFLYVWGLFGSGDLWFLLSSVLLDALAGLSLLFCVTRLYGAPAGLIALSIFAVFPIEVSFAATLRMYSLFSLTAIWLWYHLEAAVAGHDGKARLSGVAVLAVSATLCHGAGFIIVFALMLQTGVRVMISYGVRRAFRLVLAYLPAVVAALYPLAVGAVREAGVGLDTFDLEAIGSHLTIFLLGYLFPFAPWAGCLALVVLSAVTLMDARARGAFLRLVLLPMAILLILSITVQPVFLFRTLGLLSIFVIVSLALGLEHALRQGFGTRLTLALVMPVLFVPSALNYSLSDTKQGYREIAAAWVSQAEPDAVLLTEGTSDFWGILRYDGEGTGHSALIVQPPVRDGMARLKDRLEGTILDRMGFFGEARFALRGNRSVFVHIDKDLAMQEPQREIWLVTRGATGCVDLDREEVDRFTHQGLLLLRCGPA